MDLTTFKFPNVTGVDMAFSTFKTIPELLEAAKENGFYNGHTPYNKLFSNLFFSGGKISFKKDIHPNLAENGWNYCRAFMTSWEPKHKDKEAICAYLMFHILEPTLEPIKSKS